MPEDFADKGLKKGGAYLANDDFEFLGYVDLSKTDEEFAKLFHIDLEKLVNQNPKIENDVDLILVQDGEIWQEHGKFVYKDSRLDSSITK